jgi:putative ABC transport system substrate-binding protein
MTIGNRQQQAVGKLIAYALCMMLFAPCSSVESQQQPKVPNIGFLGARPAASATGLDRLRRELRALGYIEGKNIAVASRYADNKLDRLPALADELVRLKVDVLLAAATPEALAAKNATRDDPHRFCKRE